MRTRGAAQPASSKASSNSLTRVTRALTASKRWQQAKPAAAHAPNRSVTQPTTSRRPAADQSLAMAGAEAKAEVSYRRFVISFAPQRRMRLKRSGANQLCGTLHPDSSPCQLQAVLPFTRGAPSPSTVRRDVLNIPAGLASQGTAAAVAKPCEYCWSLYLLAKRLDI